VRRSILLSLLVIGAAVALLAAGSLAQFRDTDTSVGNSLASGDMNLLVYQDGKWRDGEEIGPVVSAEGLTPCDVVEVTIPVKNDGDDDGEVWVHFKNVHNAPDGLSEPEGDVDPDNEKNALAQHIHVDINGEWIRDPDTGDPLKLYPDIQSNWYPVPGLVLPPGEQGEVKISFHIQEEAPPELQTDRVWFDLDLGLEQAE
jgi:predicted ribosomally synthesized peptide with SipW-like signal peptide